MIREIFGNGSVFSTLRKGLDEATAAQHRIANRVANATAMRAGDGFAGELARQQGAGAPGDEDDLERSMVELADTQLRFDATAKMLQGAYAKLRTAMRNG